MKLGTHNSLTSYKLFGWLKYFCWLINPICRCLTKTIEEQLNAGVRWFNLQVNIKNNRWIGSHGIAWYDVELLDVLNKINNCAEKCYVQIYLDKHFGTNTSHDLFILLIDYCKKHFSNIILQRIYNEQDDVLVEECHIECEEKYWTTTWAKKWWLKLPIPKLWHKFYLSDWSKGTKEYLMNDFV